MEFYGIQEAFPSGPVEETAEQCLERFNNWFNPLFKVGKASSEDRALAALYRLDLEEAILWKKARLPECPFRPQPLRPTG
jgi:hypothetical protein